MYSFKLISVWGTLYALITVAFLATVGTQSPLLTAITFNSAIVISFSLTWILNPALVDKSGFPITARRLKRLGLSIFGSAALILLIVLWVVLVFS